MHHKCPVWLVFVFNLGSGGWAQSLVLVKQAGTLPAELHLQLHGHFFFFLLQPCMGRFLNKIFIVSSRVLPIPEIHIVLMQNIWLIFNGAYLFFFF